jgi:hypothetical protein
MTVTGSVSISGTPSVTITGTPSVNITGTANINIYGQSTGVYLQPEWAAKNATDINKPGSASDVNLRWGANAVQEMVPTGKTWFITQWSASAYLGADTAAIPIRAILQIPANNAISIIGGINAASCVFNKPIRATAGQTVVIWVAGYVDATGTVYAVFHGYEV